jgi:hypothetical protein
MLLLGGRIHAHRFPCVWMAVRCRRTLHLRSVGIARSAHPDEISAKADRFFVAASNFNRGAVISIFTGNPVTFLTNVPTAVGCHVRNERPRLHAGPKPERGSAVRLPATAVSRGISERKTGPEARNVETTGLVRDEDRLVASGAVRQDTGGSQQMAITTRIAGLRELPRGCCGAGGEYTASEGSQLAREKRGGATWIKSVSRCL